MAGFTLKTQVLAMMDKGRSHAQHRLSRSLSTTALGIASRVLAELLFADKANDIFKQSQQCPQGTIQAAAQPGSYTTDQYGEANESDI